MDIIRVLGRSLLILMLVNQYGVIRGAEISVDCHSLSILTVELGETVQILCSLSNLNNQTFTVYWTILRGSVTRRILPTMNSKYTEIINRINDDISRVTLSISKIDVQDEAQYEIEFTSINIKTSVKVQIQGQPRITNKFRTIYGRPGFDLLLDCRVQAWPYATSYKWYYQNKKLNYDSQHQIYDRTYRDRSISHTYLKILNFNHSHTGNYVCMALNRFGEGKMELDARVGKSESIECKVQYKCNILQTCDLDHGCLCLDGYKEHADGSCSDIDECLLNIDNCDQECSNAEATYSCSCYQGFIMDDLTKKCIEYVEPPKPPVDNMTIYAIVGVIIIFVIICIIVVVVYIFRKRHRQSKSTTPPPQYIFEKSSTPSASIVHEFSVNKVEIQYEIGKGRFGKVYLARAWDITGTGTWETVALKQSREDITEEDSSAFLHELNLVKKIPCNRHIVRCLGYLCQPMMSMLIEYMPFGDLLTYLRQKRSTNFKISNYSINTDPLTASHLFNFALQCAKGMQHLHENKIIHRDLAARNILVFDEHCCKISDFGMARKVCEGYSYTSRSPRPLPILWMAPEAIFNDRTSNKSDIWSYGVLFWEMITIGSRPYPGKSGPQVLQMLKNGEKMEKPIHCANEIYRILTNCWQFNADSRPEFHEIVDEMEMRLESAENYIALNNYNLNNYCFIDHVSMSDLDLDQSDDELNHFHRSRSRHSLRAPICSFKL